MEIKASLIQPPPVLPKVEVVMKLSLEEALALRVFCGKLSHVDVKHTLEKNSVGPVSGDTVDSAYRITESLYYQLGPVSK